MVSRVSFKMYPPLEGVRGRSMLELEYPQKKEKLPYGSFSLDIGYDTKGRAIFPDIG
jgi:hypothetical protein